MANTDEPRRETPRDLYPEWTTRPHAVHVKDRPAESGREVRAAPPRNPLRGAWVLALIVLGVIAAFAFVGRERFQTRQRPAGNGSAYAPDTQLEEVARTRVHNEPDLRDVDVTIVVREQIATVSGRVADEPTREKVLNVVRMTPNVSGVIDHVTVGSSSK